MDAATCTATLPITAARPHADELERRLTATRPLYVVETPEQEFLFRTMVASAHLAETCRNEEMAVRDHLARRAGACWDADRAREAVRLGTKLARNPELHALDLAATKHGCDWLLAEWSRLGRALEANGEWTEAQGARAFDLLGVPAIFRDNAKPNDRGETPTQLVARETTRLRELRDEALIPIDDHRREMAALGFDPVRNPHVDRLRACERAALRRFRWAQSLLQRRDADATVAEPAPAPRAAAPPPVVAGPRTNPGPPTEEDVMAYERDFWKGLLTDQDTNFLDALARFSASQVADAPTVAVPAAPIARPLTRKQRREAEKLSRRGVRG